MSSLLRRPAAPAGTRVAPPPAADTGALLTLNAGSSSIKSASTPPLSGLKGLSAGLSNDMRTLESAQTREAGEAIDYFVFRVRREMGGLAAALGGLDAVVFTGGIGENSASVRQRVLQGMTWLGVELDESRNREGQAVISSNRSRVLCLRIPTDEEGMIARHTLRVATQTQEATSS